jgi:hypothetical protein
LREHENDSRLNDEGDERRPDQRVHGGEAIVGCCIHDEVMFSDDYTNIDKYLLINNKNTSLFDKNYPHRQKQDHLHLIKHWYEVDY